MPVASPPNENEKWERIGQVTRAFSPAAPVTTRDLFAGRLEQMDSLMEVIVQPGTHAVVYGERGVGKTSLARVIASITATGNMARPIQINCGESDSFDAIWRRIVSEIGFSITRNAAGFVSSPQTQTGTLAGLLSGDGPLAPDDIRRALSAAVTVINQSLVIFIDEFDRLGEDSARAPFADTIKALSDFAVPVTIVLVGVADNVDQLVAQHRSIERALHEIRMPRMAAAELADIVHKGLADAELEIHPAALDRLVELSQGLPHYTHLLAQHAGRSAVASGRDVIESIDVRNAVVQAIEKVEQTVREEYLRATHSARPNNLYAIVLRACAEADKDEMGFFTPAAVRDPLRRLSRRNYDIAAFQQHLQAFLTHERAAVLQRVGQARAYKYRFRNPLLQPYVVLRGVKDDEEQLASRS